MSRRSSALSANCSRPVVTRRWGTVTQAQPGVDSVPNGRNEQVSLRILGSLEVLDPSGREIRSVLAQPKRLALLSYLALARPDSYRRRDAVVALFWPEFDQSRARAALR